MKLNPVSPNKSINKAYRKEKVGRSDIELFKNNLKEFLAGINEKESEEHVKNNVTNFLYQTYYQGKNQINTKGRIDLAIYEEKKPVVIIEAKRPNSTDMVSLKNLNAKAMHELMLYYLRERIEEGNTDIKFLVATNMYEWFVFDASVFDKLFYQDSALRKEYVDWKSGRKPDSTTDFFYSTIATKYLKDLNEEITFTWLDLRDIEKIVLNEDPKDDNHLIPLFKLLSPAHLLKQPFANDSNSLDTKFYSELLHIIGLEETKDGGKKLIQRKDTPDAGSLLENAINILIAEDRLHKLPRGGADFGETKDKQLFNVALELCITWVNRILFLKLLEGQLQNYHNADKRYRFLDFKTIPNYDELNKLFFQVLARKHNERTGTIREKFALIPYLNSSLFDISPLEDDTIRINSLDDGLKLKLSNSTVLKDNSKKREGELPTLQYLFEFLNSYDFTSEGKEEIQEENKGLINASVLGLIFEKINGYKDGSFFTPGFITMYMCRETIRRAVVQKFKETKGWELEAFDDLHNHITAKDIEKANEIINSLKICDPAVGSGHFLVSALNEIIAIKSELGVLVDRNGKVLRDYAIEVINDELIASIDHNEFFEYKPGNKESQRVQETLFHEKQTIIENCLFGVDINPNSVKICRLRLWIELLKNSYYTEESKYLELETLPNIDINIKQGNSLISRFPLDADLSKALKSIKYNIDDYRAFVNNYKNATDKEAKRGLEVLINQIKSDFRTEIGKNDPKLQKKNKLGGELFNLLNQVHVFEPTEKEKKGREEKKKKLESEINKLAIEIEEIKNSAIYKDAFEWRFEFPEVLDKEGKFIGFDVVLGNPPYLSSKEFDKPLMGYLGENYTTSQYQLDLYVSFIERGVNLLKDCAFISYITPNSWLKNMMFTNCRDYLLNSVSFKIIFPNLANVFDEASVDTLIFIAERQVSDSAIQIFQFKNKTLEFKHTVNQIRFKENDRFIFDVESNDALRIILEKIRSNSVSLESVSEITRGVNPYDKYQGQSEEIISSKAYHSNYKKDKTFIPEIRGKHVSSYSYNWDGKSYISYGDWLAAPREKRFFQGPRIIMRQVLGQKLNCTVIEEEFIIDQSVFISKPFPETEKYIYAMQGILASKLLSQYFKFSSNEFDALFPKIKIGEFRELPIPKDLAKVQNIIGEKVQSILELKRKKTNEDTSRLEEEIDHLVYKFYGLTVEEITTIEQNK